MTDQVTWGDQRTFLAVLEEGSLSGGARRLGVTQPTARARIDALEQALGTVLFTRSGNGLVPTREALALADSARAMARASEAFVRAASSPVGAVAGTVRLSVSELIGFEALPEMLASLRRVHPEIIVEVSLSDEPADLLEQEVDIAIRMHQPRQQALIAQKVGAVDLGFFAHRDYLAWAGTPTSMAELVTHDFIGPDRSRLDLRMAASLDPVLERDRFKVRVDSHAAQLAFARSAIGIIVTQKPVGLADPHLVPVLPEISLKTLDVWVVTHESLRHILRVEAVFEHLVQTFSRFAKRTAA